MCFLRAIKRRDIHSTKFYRCGLVTYDTLHMVTSKYHKKTQLVVHIYPSIFEFLKTKRTVHLDKFIECTSVVFFIGRLLYD